MSLLRRISNLLSHARIDREIAAELRAHVDLRIADNIAAGMSPEDARRDALVRFGNPTSTRERVAAADAALTLSSVWADVRYGLRQLRRSPGFTCVALITLALGIGAVTAVFSLIDAVLLRMLPVEDPEHLVQFKSYSPAFPTTDSDSPITSAFSYPAFKKLSEQTQALAGVLAFRRLHGINFEVDGNGGLAEGQLVSGSYFTVLGVKAIRGRTILPADDSVAGPNPIAVIGYDYRRTRFALDPDIVGKNILLNNAPFTIVGVTEPEFYGLQPGARVEVSVPLSTMVLVNLAFAATGTPADVMNSRFRNWLWVIGRLHAGITRDQATAGLQPVFAQLMRDLADALAGTPGDSPARREGILEFRLQLEPAGKGIASLRQQFSKPLWIVMAVVGLLLLITCANVANLLLARTNAREREIAVRLAMGAAKVRLMRQLITESILLGFTGGALGIGMAYWGSSSLLALMAHGRSPVTLRVHLDLTVLAFALAVSLLTALIFGTIPAWRATDVTPSSSLAKTARSQANAREGHNLRKALVVIQVSVSLVLVIGAGLLARSLTNLRDFYPGFNRDNVLLFHVDPTIVGVKDVVPLYEQMLSRLRQIPGVRTVSLSVHEPLSSNVSDSSVKVQGAAAHQGEDLAPVNIEPIGPEYFATMETPLMYGREFAAADRVGTQKVAIVNQGTARHFFGDANPIGRSVSIPGYRGDESSLQIVGVVRDIKVHDLREAPTFMLYVPILQAPEGGATFEVRTAIDPVNVQTAVLDAIRGIDSRLPVHSIRSLGDQLDASLVEERLVASLSSTFGLFALLLTSVGLYGLMSYTVNRRTSEIGIRMALGAKRGRIAVMVMRETLALVGCGLGIGVPAAFFASRMLSSQLFGLKAGDPVTILTACATMAIVTLSASYLPARRAASVNPIQALRSE